MLYDVFISHSSKDQADVSKIVSFLEQSGFKCFVSYRDIPHCEDWADYLIEALEQSRCVVYVHTISANNSNQIIREIQISVDDMKKPFVTYRLTDEPFKGGKKYFLQTLNWIDSLGNPELSLPLLAKTLRTTIDNAESSQHSLFSEFSKKGGETTRNSNRKKSKIAIYIASSLALICVVIGAVYFMRENKKKEFTADMAEYTMFLQHSDENMLDLKNPEAAFRCLDSADFIVKKYSSTKYRNQFSVDTGKRRSMYRSVLSEKLLPLNEQIEQWYGIYDLIPSEEVKNNIISSIDKVQAIDRILGRKDAEKMLDIKKKLQQ